MKLASIANGTRDGLLAVVSEDLRFALPGNGIAATLHEALEPGELMQEPMAGLSAERRCYATH